ncbi:hypothetical protein [Raineyella sp. W15-4]|uniref:hypothetical protein n=1 Tax=Raineyella sp. W15-4 TaxID=3081651 RepID=UPI00295451A1|nr:hypothetical protein [Raineyella sp. W15-4]WOQ16230.1 hypothetical protein R0145_13600 [Raineyella sp. W15-4]
MSTLKNHAKRAAVVIVATASLFGLAGCRMGFEHQTLQQYTQAEGVDLDLADGHQVEQGRGYIKVRNLMVLAQPDGSEARLAGTLYGSPSSTPFSNSQAAQATEPTLDTLQSVSGRALTSTGDSAGTLSVTLPEPLPITVQKPVQLEAQNTAVTGAKVTPGLDVELTLTFQNNGRLTARVPVVDATKPDYATMSPVAAAASPNGTASPNATATASASPRANG